jgi:alkylation response protein AidB-like acyl-CoA dehydrogenase
MSFAAPTADQLLALTVNAGLPQLAAHERFAAATPDMAEAIAEGIARFAQGEWAPLNRSGDTAGARCVHGRVTLPAGYAEAYAAFVEQGWGAIAGPGEHDGQDLPFSLAACVMETLGTANLGFTLLPILTQGAAEAIHHHGTPEQQARYLPRLLSGEWSGTMNLTEPQAGSDVGALRTMATPISAGPHAGLWSIKGTKIFITWGEHDLAGNIVHLVLARTPGAPAGSRGISLFLVPKFLPGADGTPGARNDLRAVSIEHKLGIHASPTCVMSYGDNDACVGELLGAEHDGLRCMFTMMNAARISVGSQGVQVAEAALQQASAYARERIQSPRAGSAEKSPVAIIEHPDVRRMILRMTALTQAGRALLYYTTGQIDRAALGDADASARADVLVPLAKAWCTDLGCEVASLGIQVHGGMGFIEEAGAAQFYRDARILPIYEGTNGIQAADFVTRKLDMDGGAALLALLGEVAVDCSDAPALASLARRCAEIARHFLGSASLDDRLAGSVAFATMCAVAVAGWQLQRQARFADADRAKAVVARYFAQVIAAEARGLDAAALCGMALLDGLQVHCG